MNRPHILLAGSSCNGLAVPIARPRLFFASAHTSGLAVRLEGQSQGLFDAFRQAGDLAWRVVMCSPLAAARGAGEPSRFAYSLEGGVAELFVDQWGSADLAFFVTALLDRLALACGEENLLISPLAATGHLFGAKAEVGDASAVAVQRVSGIESKLCAALTTLSPIESARILIPGDNVPELSSEHRAWVQRGVIVPVHQLQDVLDALKTLPVLSGAMREVLHDLHAPFEGNPYRGIEAFGIEHRGLYFGRQARIDEVLSRLPDSVDSDLPAVLIGGFSGSGKSSLLLAGVLGTVLHTQIKGHRFLPSPATLAGGVNVAWRVPARADITEAALCEALLSHWGDVLDVAFQPVQTLQALGDILVPQLRPCVDRPGRWVFALDQLEALVTQVGQGDAARQLLHQILERFAQLLERLIRDAGVWVLATVRTGYLEALGPLWKRVFHAPGYIDLSEPLHSRIDALSEGERWECREAERRGFLHEVIERPARLAGFTLEEGLLEDLIRDARDPQSLPLLEFALQVLYERAASRRKQDASAARMMRADYEVMGGIRGAINRRADHLLARVPEGRDVLLGALARLAREQGQGEYVRVTTAWSSYSEDEKVLLAPWFDAEHRLLTRQGDQIEVAHEALLREFTALRDWLLSHSQLLRWRQDHLLPQMRRWDEGGRGNACLLLSRDDLEMGTRALAQPELLGDQERVFVQLSLDEAQRRVEEERKKVKELDAAKRRALRRTRIGLGVTSLLLVVAVLMGEKARQADRRAEIQLEEAASRAMGRASQAQTRHDTKSHIAFLTESLRFAENNTARTAAAMVLQGHGLPEAMRKLRYAMHHGNTLDSARFSPDGQWIVTKGDDGAVRLWNAQTGEQVGNKDGWSSASLSQDGRWAATVSQATVHIWDTLSGKAMGTGLHHAESVRSVRFSTGGPWVATVSGAVVSVWDVQTGRLAGEPLQHDFRVYSADISPDGRRIASSGAGGVVNVWDVESGDLMMAQWAGNDDFWEVEFGGDGRVVVATELRGSKRIFDSDTGLPIDGKEDFREILTTARLSPNGRKVVAARRVDARWLPHTRVQVWDSGPRDPAEKSIDLSGEEDYAKFGLDVIARFSPEGRWVITMDGISVRLWDAETGKPAGASMMLDSDGKSMDFSPDGRWMVTTTAKRAQVWEVRTGKPIGEMMRHEGELLSSVFSPDGRWIMTSGRDGMIRVWHVQAAGATALSFRHEGAVETVEFSSDGRWIVTASDDFTVRVWDVKTGSPANSKMKHEAQVQNATFSPDDRLILTWGDSTARVWGVQTGEAVGVEMFHPGGIIAAEFGPDGRSIITTDIDGGAMVWDFRAGTNSGKFQSSRYMESSTIDSPDGSFTAKIIENRADGLISGISFDYSSRRVLGDSGDHHRWVTYLDYSQEGPQVITAPAGSMVRIWDREAGEAVGSYLTHVLGVSSLVFSPDSRWIMTAGEDIEGDTLRLWEARTGLALGGFLTYGEGINAARFSPDGRWVVAAGWEGTARIWSTTAELGAERTDLAGALRALSGIEIDANGYLRELAAGELLHAREELRHSAGGNTQFDKLVAWHFDDPSTRPISPFSQQTIPQFIEAAIDFATAVDLGDERRNRLSIAALEEAYHLDPVHPLILLALAAYEESPDTVRLWKDLSLKRIANDARLASRAAELLQWQGDRDSARRAAQISVSLDSDNAAARAVLEWARGTQH